MNIEKDRMAQSLMSQNPLNYEQKIQELEISYNLQSQINAGKATINRLTQSKLRDFDNFVNGTMPKEIASYEKVSV